MIQNTLLFSTKFNAAVTVPKFVLTDLSPYSDEGISLANIKGIFKIESPTGIIYNNTNFGAPDITGNVSLVFSSVSIPLDTTGAIVTGNYKVTYTIRVAGGTQPGDYTFIDTSYYCYVGPTGKLQVTNSVRLATVTSSDLTTYNIAGVAPTLTRTHTLYYPSVLVLSPLVGSTAQLNLAYPNVYTGTYTGKLSTIASYTFPDGLIVDYLVTAVDESIVDGSTLCDIYCGLKNLTTEFMTAESTGDFGKAGQIQDILSTVGFLLDLYDQAITCGKPDDATTWLNEIMRIANITVGCGCDGDEPTQIIPIGGIAGGTTIVAGDSSFGTSVSSATVGSTTTYTVRLTEAYKELILSALQTQDLSVVAFRAANIPEEARGVQVTPLAAGGSTISLTPGTSKKVLVITGNPTLSGSTTIQTVGSPIDGDSFIVDYRAAATPAGNNVTIFGIQLSDSEVASGNSLIFTWYAASNTTWYAKILSNNSSSPQDGLVYWQSGPDYVLNKAVLYGSNPSYIYKNILAAGSGTNAPTGTTGSNAYWQYVGNKSTLSDGSDNIVFDVTTGQPFILPTLDAPVSAFEFLVLEGQQIKKAQIGDITAIGTSLPENNILIGNASNLAAIMPFTTDALRGRPLPITGITGSTFTIITVATSGTVNLTPSVATPTVKIIGTTTLVGNYSISSGSSGANIFGDYFWFDYNANVTLSGNNLTIFGVALTAPEALSGNLAIYSYWDSINATWVSRKIIYGQTLPIGSDKQTVRYNGSTLIASSDITSDGSGNARISKSLVIGNSATPTNKSLVISDNSTDIGTRNVIIGENNATQCQASFIGGHDHIVAQFNNIVGGEFHNVASSNNIASGYNHIISVNVNDCLVIGRYGYALNGEAEIHSNGLTPGTAQSEKLLLTITTVDATLTSLLNNGQPVLLSNNSAYSFEYKISAVQKAGASGTLGDTKTFTIRGAVKIIGGAISLVGTQAISEIFTDSGATTWTGAVIASGSSLLLTVTGEVNKSIQWVASLTMVKSGY